MVYALLSACGGGGGDDGEGGGGGGNPDGNAAVDHAFSYGNPQPATSTQANVLQSAVSNVVSVSSTPSASAAVALASFTSVTAAFLGSSPAGVEGPRPLAGARLAQSYDAGCLTITATLIQYNHCVTTTTEGSTSIDGSFMVSGDGSSLTWDLTVASDVNVSGSQSSLRYHQSGTVAVTATTIVGDMLAEMHIDGTYSGTHYVYGVSEALVLDLTYQTSPPCITGGTLEAKRVWTERPSGVPAGSLPDRAAKIVWTGCNQATFAPSS